MQRIDTPETEAKYQRLEALGKKLGIPLLCGHLALQITKNGMMVTHRKQRSHSWSRNVYNLIFCQLGSSNPTDATFGSGLLSYRKTDGNITRYTGSYGAWVTYIDYYDPETRENESAGRGSRAAANSDNHGLVVGASNAAEDFEHYNLQAPIANGLGAGQLSMIAQEAPVLSYDAGAKTLTDTMVRFMNNNSGGDITVREVGYICKMQTGTAYSMSLFLFSRDVLDPVVVIPNAGQIRIQYQISLAYPV
ncbi:hypothetical protein [Dehalococcoides mccartyi]|jgi:hypothetical protein|uniref:hypothetical protein n=1 Tax=Dehalococcoides mccartyi TaxID=61435 RepID=UPI0004E04A79|nr:hypothetical protein [Dehalococcoides mccartyi]AII57404.1 hypothetical protein X792_01070 [Dehalococcoides mccartyi CG1]